MEFIKKIISPIKIEILKSIKKRGETNENGLTVGNSYSKTSIRLAIKRLSELELIKFTGGGYFEISSKGADYLEYSKASSNKESEHE